MKRKSSEPQDDFSKRVKADRPLLQVYCRVRPIASGEQKAKYETTNTELAIGTGECYTFTQVFAPESTQEQVYSSVGHPAVSNFLSGKSSLIFAYGITSSGKTHTMLGSPQAPGLIPRVLEALTNRNAAGLSVSFYEIYNEQIYDLLNHRAELRLRQDDTSTRIVDLSECPVSSQVEASLVLDRGQKSRKVHGTALNEVSSRSHSVFSLNSRSEFRTIQLTIVDLAGAERTNRTETQGARLQEAKSINSSLHVLHKCITALRNSQIAPYRESKLTQALRDFFVGETVVALILNVNPRVTDLEETRSALKFASIAAEISVRPGNKAQSPADARCQTLQEEVDRLRDELKAVRSLCSQQESSLKSQISSLQQQLSTVESATRLAVVQEMAVAMEKMHSEYQRNIALVMETQEEIILGKNRIIEEGKKGRAASAPGRERKKRRERRHHRKRIAKGSPIASRTRKRLLRLASVPPAGN